MNESSFIIDINRTKAYYKLEIFVSGDIVNTSITLGIPLVRKYFKTFHALVEFLDRFFREENIKKIVINEKYLSGEYDFQRYR